MKIVKGSQIAKKVVIYGPEGVSKSLLAAKFPDPLFIDAEGSTKDMEVDYFETTTSWAMVKEQANSARLNSKM